MLYEPSDEFLALSLAEADAGDGSRMLWAADVAWGRNSSNGDYAQANQGYWAIGCLDVPWPADWTDEDVWALGASMDEDQPRLGSSSLSGELVCRGWPASTPPPATGAPATGAPAAPPLLLVNGRYDPSTPFQNALELQEALGNDSIVVSYEGDGHGTLLADRSGCSFEVMRQFLLDGTVDVTSCP
jgi:pimeloyl-ACP methyl ester carboxylesterase